MGYDYCPNCWRKASWIGIPNALLQRLGSTLLEHPTDTCRWPHPGCSGTARDTRASSGRQRRDIPRLSLYHGSGLSSSKNPPVGPWAGSVARRTAARAPCSTLRVP